MGERAGSAPVRTTEGGWHAAGRRAGRRRFRWTRRSPTTSLLAARVRDLREAPQLPGQAAAGRQPARPGGGGRPPGTLGRRQEFTFTIRHGFRFSPPSNQQVTAETFRYTIERTLNPTMKSPAAKFPFITDIVGEPAYEAGKAKHISGITVHGNRLTIRLTDDKAPCRVSSPPRSSAPSRPTRPSTRAACRRSPPPARITSPPTHPARASC